MSWSPPTSDETLALLGLGFLAFLGLVVATSYFPLVATLVWLVFLVLGGLTLGVALGWCLRTAYRYVRRNL